MKGAEKSLSAVFISHFAVAARAVATVRDKGALDGRDRSEELDLAAFPANWHVLFRAAAPYITAAGDPIGDFPMALPRRPLGVKA